MVGITRIEDKTWWKEHEAGNITYKELMERLSDKYRQSGKKQTDFVNLMDSQAILNTTQEVRELLASLKQKGNDLCIVSGGIDLYVKAAAEILGITRWYAHNTLKFDEKDNFLRIDYAGDDVGQAKVSFLKKIGTELNISPENIFHIGDGSNDIDAFRYTGNGVYLRRSKNKPLVKAAAKWEIDSLSQIQILF